MSFDPRSKYDLIEEIVQYCEQECIISYYDLKTYALLNKPEWYGILKSKNNREVIREYQKSMKRKNNIKYKEDYCDVVKRYIKAEIEVSGK